MMGGIIIPPPGIGGGGTLGIIGIRPPGTGNLAPGGSGGGGGNIAPGGGFGPGNAPARALPALNAAALE